MPFNEQYNINDINAIKIDYINYLVFSDISEPKFKLYTFKIDFILVEISLMFKTDLKYSKLHDKYYH